MGSSSSKQAGSQQPLVWKGSAPATSLSQELIETLQSSTENDASRAQTLELQIQARVAAELQRLQAEEDARRREIEERLSAQQQDDKEPPTTRQKVSQEVEALRVKLESRRQVRQLPESVEQARGEVVRCLRDNDRRPLDCWKEVEAFKEEVRRLEKGWVEKVVS